MITKYNSLHGVYETILRDGKLTSPRGLKVLELEDALFKVDDIYCNFPARKYSWEYLKAELLWYLRGIATEDSILEHASIWGQIRQPSGEFFSNYGQYWFRSTPDMSVSGFMWVIEELQRDPDSRRAVIPMLRPRHIFKENKDVVCTYAVSFRIRDNQLNMSVNMRSNDAIIGMSYDIPAFDMLHQMVAVELGIKKGCYHHKADSLHVYERHFGMLEKIVSGDPCTDVPNVPPITDVWDLLFDHYKSPFGRWLHE